MCKTEITAARRKSAYICPKIVCIPVEYSLCAASKIGGSAGKTSSEPDELCAPSPFGGSAGTADYDCLLEKKEVKDPQ